MIKLINSRNELKNVLAFFDIFDKKVKIIWL